MEMPPIILFDGVCNFCNSTVNFIIKHDKKAYFRFSPLQGITAKQLLQNSLQDSNSLSTIILFDNGKLYTKSDAALIIVSKLNGLLPLLYIFILIPRFIRNWIYDRVARNRYKWFGKKESCMIPDAGVKARFME